MTIDPYATRAEYGALRFLHRMNPLALVAAPVPAMIALILTRDIATPLAFLILALLLVLVGAHLSSKVALGLFVGVPLFAAIISLSFGLWADASRVDTSVVLFQLGDYRFYLGAYLTGLATALRLSAILVLARVAKPFAIWKIGLIAAMAAFLGLALVFDPLRDYFVLVDPPSGTIIMMAIVIAATGLLLPLVWRIGDWFVGVAEERINVRSKSIPGTDKKLL